MRRRTITIAVPQQWHCSLGRSLKGGSVDGCAGGSDEGSLPAGPATIALGLSPMRSSARRQALALAAVGMEQAEVARAPQSLGQDVLQHQPQEVRSFDGAQRVFAAGTVAIANTKWRTLESGERRDYKACDSLQSHITRLYKRAGIKGSNHSGRRGFAGKVLASTGDMDTVALLLGHSSIDCSQRYVDVDRAILEAMFRDSISESL